MTFGLRTAALPVHRSLLLLACVVLLAQACMPQPITVTPQSVTLRLAAADSFAPLIDDVVAAYEESHPWVRVNTEILNTAMAEGTLRDGGADLALLSWLGEPEDGRELWVEAFARDSIAVIVHPASPFTEIGLAQLQQIFCGRMQEWDGTVITVVSREDGSGTRAAFETIALAGDDTTLNAVVMPSGEAVLEHVASTPGAIGYTSTLRLDEDVRVLSLEGVLPTERTVSDGSYPLWRQLYLASSGEPDGEAREFAQWLLQHAGMLDPAAVVNP